MALAVVSVAGFGALALSLRRPEFVEWVVVSDTPDGIVLDFTGVAAAFLAGFLLAVPLHEAVHGAVANALGYRVSYGVATNVGGFYAAAFGQFQPREHLLPVAPLVVGDAVGLALVAFAPVPVAAGDAVLRRRRAPLVRVRTRGASRAVSAGPRRVDRGQRSRRSWTETPSAARSRTARLNAAWNSERYSSATQRSMVAPAAR